MQQISNTELTVLLLEENSYVALELESLINTTGYQTITISDISKGSFTPLYNLSFDFIVMNITHKENTAYLEAIAPFKTNTPIIYTSGYNNDNTLNEVLFRKVIRNAILKLNIQSCIDTYKAVISNGKLYFLKKGVYYKVTISDILFIKAEDDYSIINTQEGSITIFLNLNKLEQLLEGYSFVRTHRSFLINTEKASYRTVNGNNIFIEQHQIPISRSRKKKIAALDLGLEEVLTL